MIKINLLPKELKPRTETDYWMIGWLALALISGAALFLANKSANDQLAEVTAQADSLQAELLSRQKYVTQQTQLQQQEAELQVYSGVEKQLQTIKTNWSSDLKRFISQMPLGGNPPLVSLNNLNMRSSTGGLNSVKDFTLQGTARSQESLVKFVKAFESSKDFSVQFQNAQTSGDATGYSFTMNVSLLNSQPAPTPQENTPKP